jgi:hypothetical protein
VTVAPQHRKESSADVVRRCTQNTLMLPCSSKTVDHAFDIDGHALPASSHRRSRGPVPIGVFCVHRLPASALKFLLCGAAGRCWRTHCQARVAAHASDAHLGTARVWRPVLVVANGCAVSLWFNTFYCVRRPLWGVAIIDGARLWPVGHNPALFINAMRLPGVTADQWPIPWRMDRPVPRR